MSGCPFQFTRRNFLKLAGLTAAAGAGFTGAKLLNSSSPATGSHATEPFWGVHQSGIVTPAQNHTYFATFDLTTNKKEDVIALLKSWTEIAARMAQGQAADPIDPSSPETQHDGGDSLGISPSRLTLTFGFGPSLFIKDGKDRYNLAALRPEALVDLPPFSGDELVPEHTNGDLSVQACADDPQVAFHAIRQLVRHATPIAQVRWTQAGFVSYPTGGGTPRNLMGFKDGTGNPDTQDSSLMDQHIWAGSEGPAWMQGGSYVVARRIRIALEHWDQSKVGFQEQVFGRKKISGAPLTGQKEFDAANLEAVDTDGNPVIAENSHLRLATAATNKGVKILRRSYSYNDGVNYTAERWPPWRQGMEYDAGLLFVCYQKDPRTGFVSIFDKMSKFDMMNQFATHVGGGLFACPRGALKGEYIGQRLLESI